MESATIAIYPDKYSSLIDIKGVLVNEDLASIGKISIHEYLEDAFSNNENFSWPCNDGIYKVNFDINNFAGESEQQVFILDICRIDDFENITEYEYL